MVHGRKFVIAACLLLWANSQAGAPAQALTTGTVQLSYVDPADVTVSLSGPVGYAQELQVTGGQVFTDLQPGTYELRVTKEGYGNFSESLEVVAGETADAAVTLEAEESAQTLDDPGTLQITWVDPGDVKVTVRGPDGYAQETTVTGGQVFTGLAAGSYEVTTSKVGFQSSTQTLEVPADGTTSLSVVLEKQEGDAQTATAEPLTTGISTALAPLVGAPAPIPAGRTPVAFCKVAVGVIGTTVEPPPMATVPPAPFKSALTKTADA